MGISTHILDTALGRPAARVGVTLEWENGDTWATLRTTTTDDDGRCKHLLPDAGGFVTGTYRIRFATGAYCKAQKIAGFYPFVDVTFIVADTEQHYHIPLLLTANGYTTYRGS